MIHFIISFLHLKIIILYLYMCIYEFKLLLIEEVINQKTKKYNKLNLLIHQHILFLNLNAVIKKIFTS